MIRNCAALLALVLTQSLLHAQSNAPTGNPYDVLGRTFQPFFNVLLSGGRDPDKAMEMECRVIAMEGRLPKDFVGATFRGYAQSPDKVKLEAPVFGQTFTVCRNGNEVWATPGSKIKYLLEQFKTKPGASPKAGTPLSIPVSSQQAVFLIALFEIANPGLAEMDQVQGEEVRVISGGLMPEIARSAGAEDFQAALFINGNYQPRRIEITRKDFSAAVDILSLRFTPSLPASTWAPPAGEEDVYRTTAEYLEQVLFVVMNSLQAEEGSMPWQSER
jgi:hypothetical protein